MTDTTISSTYEPQAIEQSIYQRWEDAGYFAASGDGEPYCIMIPPPNVTGSLHMGHAFQDTIMDALIRYHRMLGHRTLWQAGTDHAGIATQMVVERQLEGEGKTRHDLGRDAFVERIWQWKEHSGGTISQQLRRMGASVDWARERFTMDDGLSAAVQEVFVRLYDEGLIYRGKRLVNWDPVLHTAISDLEVVAEEQNGHLWHIRYPLTGGDGHVVVATTRPETMLGDAAVAVHPDDERYKHLIGKTVTLPLANREIPVIADDYVEMEFGSGCLKTTPAHDFNDYEVGQRHDLPLINILDPSANIQDSSTKYDGLDRYAARKQIVADLQARDLIEKIEEHKLMVPKGDRSHSVVEPYLTDQWFVKIQPLADPAIKAVEDGTIRFVPDNWKNTYYEWMHNIQDWCISRQLWWGHRVPAWYDADGNIYVARDEQTVRDKYKIDAGVELTQDEDVLDTWFSSALWPFSTLGWPKDTPELRTFYTTNVLVTGFDIIFFWVARMIMFGLKFTGKAPFHEVYVTGLVRDKDGQKFSKSKGNTLDPLDFIDGIDFESLVKKRTTGLMQPHLAERIERATRQEFPDGISAYGTDALRFTFASLATQGRDVRFDLGRVEGYRNFCNKLWNATRFVLMNVEGKNCGANGESFELGSAEHWIVSLMQQTEQEVADAFKEYRLDRVAQATYSFVWDEYCSWYLEISKIVLNDDSIDESRKIGVRKTLLGILEASLRLLHPVMPFITEEIWTKVSPLAGKTGHTIMLQPYPISQPDRVNQDAMREIEWLKSIVTGVRNIRGEMNIEPAKRLPVLVQGHSEQDKVYLSNNESILLALVRLESFTPLSDQDEAPESAAALAGSMKLLIPLGSAIDKDAELKRLSKEHGKHQADFDRAEAKLKNPKFVDRAPADIVAKEKQRLSELTETLSKLKDQIEAVEQLGN